MQIRVARSADADAIARLVNRAYEVEAFFVQGDRTSVEEVHELLTSGQFLVVDDDRGGGLAGCVYATTTGPRGYFGMLAVEPAHQGRGTGGALIAACEARARDAGCRVMDISVVNVRTDLLRFYERLGYGETGRAPYVHRPVIQPVHFVTMTKSLDPSGVPD